MRKAGPGERAVAERDPGTQLDGRARVSQVSGAELEGEMVFRSGQVRARGRGGQAPGSASEAWLER